MTILIPNTMAYLTYAYFEAAQRRATRDIQEFGYLRPRLVPLYCKDLARLATLATGDIEVDDNLRRIVPDLALHLWPLDHSCPAQVRAGFAASPAGLDLVDGYLPCFARPTTCNTIPPPPRLPHRRRTP